MRTEFNWQYKNYNDPDVNHLNHWYCTYNGLELSIRYVKGADYNNNAKKNNTGTYMYDVYVSFDNHSSEHLLKLNVNAHVFASKWYRSSYAECKQHLEETVIDLVNVIKLHTGAR